MYSLSPSSRASYWSRLPGSRFRHPAAFGGTIIAMAVMGFAIWASYAPLSGAVVAMGMIKTELNRRVVQHPEGGLIKRLLVQDGDQVEAGQLLMELDNVSNDANHQMLLEMIVLETMKLGRLDAEQQLAHQFVLDSSIRNRYGDSLVYAAFQRELKIFQVRRRSLDQQLATLEAQLRALEDERRFLRERIQADTQGMRLLEQELVMNRTLESQQFVAKTRLMGLERSMTDYQSRLGEHEVALAQANQRASDVKLRLAASQIDYQRLASEEYKESTVRLVELRERLRPVQDALRRQQITAPVSGTVVSSRFHEPAQVAGPREVLMEIVPDQESLIVSAQVSVNDIRDISIGQTADLRFTAFKPRTTPIVTGHLTYISADALADRNGMPFFEVHIRPDPISLQAAGIASLQPGMAAEVFILTEGRSALDYLLAPITDTLRRSMRER